MSDASLLPNTLTAALRAQGGHATDAELQARLGLNLPTLASALTPLVEAGQVRCINTAQGLRYLLLRHIAEVGSDIPVMRISAQGHATPFATLYPLQGGGIWVDEADGVSQLHASLPWFLNDMRPQGFMGLTFAIAHPELQLGADPRHWNDDDVLKALALSGDDLPGNLVVGRAAFARYRSLPARSSRAISPLDYPALAARAMQGTLPGSSAGGEQPKFCTRLKGTAVIVKFSPAGSSAVDQRTRDLLVCEHLALQTLAQAGMPAAKTRIHFGEGRAFLEAERFDRTPESTGPGEAGAERVGGRLGMVSLLVYDSEYVGTMDNWAATANRMVSRQLLTPTDAAHLRFLEAYGVLIANTDRHYGNISLLLKDDDWQLSPTYDMLPMLFAPVNGELVPRDFASRPLRPTAATLAEWAHAKDLACTFWRTAAADERISTGFRALAADNLVVLQNL